MVRFSLAVTKWQSCPNVTRELMVKALKNQKAHPYLSQNELNKFF
jgi:hypothetical protein